MMHADCTCTSGSYFWHESSCEVLVQQRLKELTADELYQLNDKGGNDT